MSTTLYGDLGHHSFTDSTCLKQTDHARFFKSWLRRIAPDTHQDQACGSTAFAPTALAALPPQKNIGAAMRPKGISQVCGYRDSGTNPCVAHMAGDPRLPQTGDDALAIHSLLWWF